MEAQLTEERSLELQTEQEKLYDVLRVLRDVVEELDTMVTYVEKELDSITTIDELVDKKKYFRIIIDVLKVTAFGLCLRLLNIKQDVSVTTHLHLILRSPNRFPAVVRVSSQFCVSPQKTSSEHRSST